LQIHPDLVGDLWCHHWAACPPRLPVLGPPGMESQDDRTLLSSHQLSLSGLPKDLSSP
jgi:hypothetical protein